MNSLEFQKIITTHNLLKEGDTVIVGLSAGPDSVALLTLLCSTTLSLRPVAVYVDHGLRPQEVPYEISCVKELSFKFSLPSEIVKVDVKAHRKQHKTSLEESARLLRYAAFESCQIKYGATAIVVAHTADDQAEEILMRLFRGTGVKGLSGMQMKNNDIIRPLLSTSKQELLEYLHSTDLPYCIDSSNSDLSILRNRVRLELLPYLTTHINPSLRKTLCQTAELFSQEDDLVDNLVQHAISSCIREKKDPAPANPVIELQLEPFLENHIALQRRIIEHVLWRFRAKPSYRHINTLCKFASSGKAGGEIHLPLGLRIMKSKNSLVFQQPVGAVNFRGTYQQKPLQSLQIDPGTEYVIDSLNKRFRLEIQSSLPETLESGQLIVDAGKLNYPLVLRSHLSGEKFRPSGMQGRKKISRYLSDLKIPQYRRHNYPIVLSQDTVVAIVNLRVDQEFTVRDSTTLFGIITWE